MRQKSNALLKTLDKLPLSKLPSVEIIGSNSRSDLPACLVDPIFCRLAFKRRSGSMRIIAGLAAELFRLECVAIEHFVLVTVNGFGVQHDLAVGWV